jgi:hypothetical protein
VERLHIYFAPDEPGPTQVVFNGQVVGAERLESGAWHVLVAEPEKPEPQDRTKAYNQPQAQQLPVIPAPGAPPVSPDRR